MLLIWIRLSVVELLKLADEREPPLPRKGDLWFVDACGVFETDVGLHCLLLPLEISLASILSQLRPLIVLVVVPLGSWTCTTTFCWGNAIMACFFSSNK